MATATTPETTSAFAYAAAPESTSSVRLAASYGLFIDGEFVDGAAGSSAFKTISPATEEVLAEAGMSEAEIAALIESGAAAGRGGTAGGDLFRA